MHAFILHSLDCTETVQFLTTSTGGGLPTPEDGYAWTKVPFPPNEWRVVLENGEPKVVPYEEPTAVVLAAAKQAKAREVNEFRTSRLAVAHTSIGLVDSDDASVANLTSNAAMATNAKLAGEPYSIAWRLQNNSNAPLDADGLIGLANEVIAKRGATYAHSFDLKGRIDAAETIEALNMIDVAEGWPQ